MSAGELAALVTAFGISIGAVLTAIAALVNARNSAATVERLKEQIAELQDHNVIQDQALLERESTINKLIAENAILKEKVRLWQEWGFGIGRVMNEMQLEIGYLTKNRKKTGPLPDLPPRDID